MMIDSITATAISYLSGLGISCSERGVKKNIEEWYKNKMPLLELLRKHPMWRENELAIVTTITEKENLTQAILTISTSSAACVFKIASSLM